MRLNKKPVTSFFGSIEHTAIAMEITASAVRMWPDVLTRRQSALVIGVAIREHGLSKTRKAFSQWF